MSPGDRVGTENCSIQARKQSPHVLAPARHRRPIEHQPVLEKFLVAGVLVIWVLKPAPADLIVRQVVYVLEDRNPGHQPGQARRLTGAFHIPDQ